MGADISKPINYLKGPIVLNYYKHPKHGKEIYVFGDRHVYDTTCKDNIDIVTFLKNTIALNADKTIDLFVESAVKTAKFQTEGTKLSSLVYSYKAGYLFAIQYAFWDCETYKKKCPYNNLRYHYIDWRRTIDPDYEQYLMYDKYIISLGFIYNDEIDVGNGVKVTYDMFIKQQKYIDDKYFTWNTIMKKFKIDKQIANIKDKTVKRLIVKYITDYYTAYFCKPSMIYNIIHKNKIKYNKLKAQYGLNSIQITKFNKQISKVIINIIRGWFIFQDAYAITRMFRQFDDTEIQHVIVYVGALHTLFYDDILTNVLGFKLINTAEDSMWKQIKAENFINVEAYKIPPSKDLDSKQCINISEFNQPFFR